MSSGRPGAELPSRLGWLAFRDKRLLYGFVALAAIAARVALWRQAAGTPLDAYTRLETLDMNFLFLQAQGFLRGEGVLTMHRLLSSFSAWLNGGVLSTPALAPVQMALGALTGVLCAAAALRLSGSRLAALASGLLAGLYAPALMYENFFLKESATLFFSALALWSFIAARRGFWPLAGHGLAAAALPLARPAGLLWALASTLWLPLRNWRRGSRFAALLPPLALVLAFAAVFAFNSFRGSPTLLETNSAYNLQLGAQTDAKSFTLEKAQDASKAQLLLGALRNAPAKLLALTSAAQVPDNVNYYFMKEALPLLSFLPGPSLLLPLGLAGILWGVFLAWRRRAWRFGIPAANFLLMALPVCLFVVTGRYALFLAPSLALGAGCLLHWGRLALLRSVKGKSWAEPLILFALFALLLWQAIPREEPLRSDDFIAYGRAAELKYGFCQQSGEAFAKACALNPGNASAAVNLSKWLLDARQPEQALALLQDARARNPRSFGLLANQAVALLMTGRGSEAEALLLSFGEPGDERQKAKWKALLDASRQGR